MRLGHRLVTAARLVRSLEYFRTLIDRHPSPGALTLQLTAAFEVVEVMPPRHRDAQPLLVTGYYQPLFAGSLVRKPPFIHPLYGIPPDLALRHRTGGGKAEPGRLTNGQFLPYWSRAEIENQDRAQGCELVYLADPLDAFLVHVQGSALIRLRDGSIRAIHYAMKNGHPYRSIGRYLVKSGKIPAGNVNLDTIRGYLASHPGETRAILQHNPSFIFFRWQNRRDAVGSLGRPLTAGRSVAADRAWMPAGGLGFLETTLPAAGDQAARPLRRFVLVQDAGSAIRGPTRLDLFVGAGRAAGEMAGRMKQPGRILFLLLRPQFTTPSLVNDPDALL